ncbi:MAG: 7-cyano-7-deazaguanine synthase QueC [Candidatus Nitrosocaldus sp.]
MDKAICILSGGLDSTCIAAYLKEKGYELYAVTFYYGQKSRMEVERAKSIAGYIGVREHHIVDIGFMKSLYKDSNILTGDGNIPDRFDYSIVVPARNAIFLTIAGAWAFSINAALVAYGAHKDDEKNYPDCRAEFAKSMEHTLNLAEVDGIEQGLRRRLRIWSPAVEGLSKKDLVRTGYRVLGNVLFETWSCYTDGIEVKGRIKVQCGSCESCINRMRAFREAGIEDNTPYAILDLNKILKP